MARRVANPPNRFSSQEVEWFDLAPISQLEIFEEQAKSIISENKSPDLGFRYSINPYRGCFHACSYCYARPTHQYLDFGAGTDFEQKIVVKRNAAELLRDEFEKPRWKGGLLVFSGNTDCYQPLEANYSLTRKCLEVCSEYRNPVSIITKGALVYRDIDVLEKLSEQTHTHVIFSIPFASDSTAKLIEPHAPRPSARFRAMRELSRAGISVGVSLAPIIPGLNDTDIPTLLERASNAGAKTAFYTLLRLPAEVKDIFISRLQQNLPNRSERILNGLRAMKSGKLNRSEFGKRMSGEGERWQAIEWLFESSCKRFGIVGSHDERVDVDSMEEQMNTFQRPERQLRLPW